MSDISLSAHEEWNQACCLHVSWQPMNGVKKEIKISRSQICVNNVRCAPCTRLFWWMCTSGSAPLGFCIPAGRFPHRAMPGVHQPRSSLVCNLRPGPPHLRCSGLAAWVLMVEERQGMAKVIIDIIVSIYSWRGFVT